MAVWYSRKPIQLGAIKDRTFVRVTCDTVAEYRALQIKLADECPGKYYRENCKIGPAAIGRQSGRPLFHVPETAVWWLEDELGAIEVPDGYLEILIYRLKYEFLKFGGHRPDKREKRYFQTKFSYLVRELHLGKIGDSEREPPDAIRRPEELDDTTEEDDPSFVAKVRHRVSMIKILNGQIENLDRGQCSPLNLSVEPTEKELEKWIPHKKRQIAKQKREELPNLEDLPPWKRAAIEKGW